MAAANSINASQKGVQMFNGTSVWTQGAYVGCYNIGIAYSAGTFTVQGADGTALSSTNPGYVILPSKATPGRLATILVTANQTFTDGSSGTTDNARFGLTTGVNWSQDIPFFLYGVMDDTEALINFMISRDPRATTSPASTSISKTGSIINVDQFDFFSLDNITVTSYDSNPCICLGAFRMQFVGATDSWTVQTLNNADGVGLFHEQTVFTLPTGVNGAASGTYILSNAGTEPTFATNAMVYTIDRNGYVNYQFNGQACNVSGVGTNTLQMIMPYATSKNSPGQLSAQNGAWLTASTGIYHISTTYVGINSSASSQSIIHNNSGFILNNTISNSTGGDSLYCNFYYQAYN